MRTPVFLAIACLITRVLAEDVSDLMTAAQRTYLRGDLAGAQEQFELIRKIDPQNRVAQGYLRLIVSDRARESAAKGPANATKAMLETIILDKVHFVDTTLPEVFEFLRQKGNQIGAGKVAINFVQKLDEKAQQARISLSLQKVPLTEVLRYVGELADVKCSYERFAIVVTSKGSEPARPAPVAEPKVPKIPGLDE